MSVVTSPAAMRGTLGFALAGLATLAERVGLDQQLRAQLRSRAMEIDVDEASLLARFKQSLDDPIEADYALLDVARHFSLTLVEVLCVRLAMAAEEDVEIGHAIAHLQAPIATHRPTVGLLARCFGHSLGASAVQIVGQGEAVRHGILRLSGDDVPLAERHVSLPLPTCLALEGVMAPWPGTHLLEPGLAGLDVPLGRETDDALDQIAAQVTAGRDPEVIVLRSGEALEARAAVHALCRRLESPAIVVESEHLEGLAPWLFVNRAVPVFQLQLAPGERRAAPSVPSFRGPTCIVAGIDGEFETEGRRVTEFRIPIPDRQQRLRLWHAHVPADVASTLANEHRHSAARIAMLARELAHRCGERAPSLADVREAARRAPNGLGAMAELIADEVPDDALVVSADLRRDLDDLVRRCRLRDGLVDELGPALRTRYRPAVRALFVGPSGTGKTLAASWIASRLGLPLFKVDLASITSKYIGETEKNISQLLSRAEQNEIVLLFDEADAMFGKRTEVRDAHDRFANAQTNFLLQRLESYDGIVLLTSNSRARFDPAFARRLDLIVEFPSPGPEERRGLWLAHLGARHALSAADINTIAAGAELSGGQIRSAVLSAAIHASQTGGRIDLDAVNAGLAIEFRKMGRQLPPL